MRMLPDLTPLMRQYRQVKQRYPDAILFFRVGDFYEMFYEDAIAGSRLLEIALTSRDKHKADQVPLCGVPYHAATSYIARLLKAGRSVAVCDQVEDPQTAKGLVRREVVRVFTPGTLIEPDLLAAGEPNYLTAIAPGSSGTGPTQPGASLSHVTKMQVSAQGGTMLLDQATQRNLELVRRAVDGQVSGSLLNVLDRTVTPLGARLLREWILHPLTNLAQIAARQEAVADLHGNLDRRNRLRTALRGVSDLERLMSRIVLGVANARDLRALKDSIAAVPAITRVLAACSAPLLRERAEAWDALAPLAAKIEQAIHPEPPASVREGGMIRGRYHLDLDELRAISRDGKTWIDQIELQERQPTGIDS